MRLFLDSLCNMQPLILPVGDVITTLCGSIS